MRTTPSVKILVLLLVIAAAAVRFYDLFLIPFTYDELSALLRTRFNSFSDLIQYGVFIDGHPAGVQVMLFYLVKCFGFSEGWIKLPFILAGITSVFLVWKIGKEWFSPNVGLLSAATVAFMHYTVVYSQIARPYGIGLFFTLVMILGWSRIVLTHIGKYRINFFLFVLGGVLCTYTHHFTLLMTGIAGVTGLFFVRGKELRKYLLACAIIVLLYLPHIRIFLYQLSMGGVEEWLNKPTLSFFIQYAKYLSDFSKIVAVAFALVFVLGIVMAIVRKSLSFRRVHFVALLFGIIPAIIGFVYSIYVSAVLQYSVLIFSMPFLLLLAFSFYEKANLRYTMATTVLWSLVLLHSLVFTREHYQYFYHSPFDESAKEIKAFTQTHSADSTLVVCSYRNEIANLYKSKYSLDPGLRYIYPDSLPNTAKLNSILSEPRFNYLILTKTNETKPWLYAYCHELFPIVVAEVNYNQGSCIILKKGPLQHLNYFTGSECSFSDSTPKSWLFSKRLVLTDSTTSGSVLKIDSTVEYEATWVAEASKIINSKANVVDASVWVYLPEPLQGEAYWVASLECDTGVVSWNAVPVNETSVPLKKWAPLSVSIFLPVIEFIPQNAIIKVYLYSHSKTEFYIRDAFAGVRKGNPAIYWIRDGLFE